MQGGIGRVGGGYRAGNTPVRQGIDPIVLKRIQDTLLEHGNRFDHLRSLLDDKVEINFMEIELAAKISKSEIESILPDMELYEQKVKSIIEETVEDNLQKIEEKFVMIDKRIGRVKNEFDMNSLQKLISSKASQEKVT